MPSKYTNEQQLAIDTDGCDLLVAAAAGSGKTAVLVERIIRLISERPVRTDIDKLLVVTFTDAAASEMRSRISDALNRRLIEYPTDDNLRKQLNLLGKASITTIHSFCLKVIRQHFNLLDIDPNFRIADEAEKKLLKSQVIADLFEEEYSKDDNEAFFDLVESYGGNRTNDGQLEDLVLDTFEFAGSYPWPDRWLEEAVARFDIPDDCTLDDTDWAGIIREDLQLSLTGARECADFAKSICLQEYGPYKYFQTIESDTEIIDDLLRLASDSLEELYSAIRNVAFMRLPSYTAKNRGDVSEALIEKVKYIRDKQIKEIIKKAAVLFIKEPSELLDDIRALHTPLMQLKRLALEFGTRYALEKKDRNILDFNDLEHYCLQILLGENSSAQNPIPSEAAKLMGQSYYEVLTDEYQDTNLIQELILSSLGASRFMVGDVKQSIYKFRRAKPELFMQKYKSFSSISGTPANTARQDLTAQSSKIDLSVNFRSRKCVLDAVNFLFCQLMRDETGGITYDHNAALYYGADYPTPEGDPVHLSDSVELAIIEKEDAGTTYDYESDDTADSETSAAQEISDLADIELEARYIAGRIKELVGKNGISVYDKPTHSYRPAGYRDIVILLRSARTNAEAINNILWEQGIPSFTDTGAGYFDSTEVQIMLSLLQIIDNPRQDIHILTVLRAPGYILSSDELLEIHGINPTKCFYDCVLEYIEKGSDTEVTAKLEHFMSDLTKWRDEAVYTPISTLIDNIYDDTGFLSYAASMQAGTVRVGNLRMLQERAAQYEKTSYKGLFHFIRYIEKLQRTRIDMDNVQVLSENDDLVRIMTIHKSKGLEFPIVFVSGLGKKFNSADERKAVIMHQELGFGPYYTELDTRVKSRTLPHIALGIRLRAENLAEELRVLYVAATRAKEKLIFTGCVKDYENKLANRSILAQPKEIQMSPHFILSAGSFLDWIAPAVCRHRDGSPLLPPQDKAAENMLFEHPVKFDVRITGKSQLLMKEPECGFNETVSVPEQVDSTDICFKHMYSAQQITDALEWEYPRKAESDLPVKVTVSEIKRRYQSEILTDKVIHIPEALRRRGMPHGAEIGTAMHTVMEHLDISLHRSVTDISALIDSLIASNILDEEAAASVDTRKILNFVNSPLADRMRASKDVRTEVPFVMSLTPYEVFGKKEYKSLDSNIMLHGIMDCFFEEDGGWILVDYKSDQITSPDHIREIKTKYALQLKLYAQAIEKMFNKPVNEVFLYLFSIDDAVPVK